MNRCGDRIRLTVSEDHSLAVQLRVEARRHVRRSGQLAWWVVVWLGPECSSRGDEKGSHFGYTYSQQINKIIQLS